MTAYKMERMYQNVEDYVRGTIVVNNPDLTNLARVGYGIELFGGVRGEVVYLFNLPTEGVDDMGISRRIDYEQLEDRVRESGLDLSKEHAAAKIRFNRKSQQLTTLGYEPIEPIKDDNTMYLRTTGQDEEAIKGVFLDFLTNDAFAERDTRPERQSKPLNTS